MAVHDHFLFTAFEAIGTMHIAVMCTLFIMFPENVGFIANYGALTTFALTAAIASLYFKIKSVIITVNRGKTEVVTT